MEWIELGDLVRRRRLVLGLSQEALAQAAKVSAVTVINIEAGRPVKVPTLWKLDRGLRWEPGTAEKLRRDELAEPPTEPAPPRWSRHDLVRLLKIIEESEEPDGEKARLRARVWQLERDLDEHDRTFEATPEI